jgi:hypothetical protein
MTRENVSTGAYGPASSNEDTGGQQAKKEKISYDFKVQVKRSCDDDDAEAHL